MATAEPLLRLQAQMRAVLLDPESLVRAVASGRRKGSEPRWRRAELRYVEVKAGLRLQVTVYDQTQAHTSNHDPESAREKVDDLLDEPFAEWRVETTTTTLHLRALSPVSGVLKTTERAEPVAADRGHDRDKPRLLAPDDPVLIALGISDAEGKVKPTRQAKLRQVEEFLRLLEPAIAEATLPPPTAADPLRILDLGCGNGYLTFAAQRLLTLRGVPVRVTGVDVKQQSAAHNTALAEALGIDAHFAVGTIADYEPETPPHVVLALHACDTATDQALARAIQWQAPLVLAAPCCHHDVAAQLRRHPTPAPYAALTRHGILRERFADTFTDALRASLLRLNGYRVDVVEFVESEHTPRNTLLRAVRTGTPIKGGQLRSEYDALVSTWQVEPALARMLDR